MPGGDRVERAQRVAMPGLVDNEYRQLRGLEDDLIAERPPTPVVRWRSYTPLSYVWSQNFEGGEWRRHPPEVGTKHADSHGGHEDGNQCGSQCNECVVPCVVM